MGLDTVFWGFMTTVVICLSILAFFWITVPHAPGKNRGRKDDREMEEMKRRMAEMENRILTLQDLVIGGDYEMRRKLEAAQRDASPMEAREPRTIRTLESE
ncbi:MAG: hypothetical protein KY468_18835 [Armatimonadetes bacterium]|nr:hypothetical protein [Armatimonadota bacterium]